MGFHAINESGPGDARSVGETQEARESRMIQLYEKALLCLAQGCDAESLVGHSSEQELYKNAVYSALFRAATIL